jgi:hypothetical protein
MADGRVFAGRTQHHQSLDAAFDLGVDELLEGRFVEFVIGRERRHERRRGASEEHCSVHG